MDHLVQSLLEGEFPTAHAILRYVPQFVAYANTLTVPGLEKRTVVLQGLHELTSALHAAGKISEQFQQDADMCIDVMVPPTIDAILDVAKGRITIPKTVEEVVPKINCFLATLQLVLGLLAKPKKVAKVEVVEVVKVEEVKVEEVKVEEVKVEEVKVEEVKVKKAEPQETKEAECV